MKKEEVDILVAEYRKWLAQEITTRQVGEYVAISTPFLDRKNDYIQVYVSNANEHGTLKISDDSNTISELIVSGCEIDTPKRKELLIQILNSHGINFNSDTKALEVITSPQDFPIKKHLLLQGILAVNDLFNLAGPQVASLFREDVENWLNINKVSYIPCISLQGKGFTHNIDFMLPKSLNKKERAVKLVNNPSSDNIKSVMFTYLDAIERFKTTELLVLINDENKKTTDKALESFNKYGNAVVPTLWSERKNNLSLFQA